MSVGRIIFILIFLSVSVVPVVHAEDKDNSEEARDIFTRAKKLYEQDKFAAAANNFRRAYELKPNWKLLFNIGQAEYAARRYGLALEMFEKYLSTGGDKIDESRTDSILEDTDKLQKMVGYIEFKNAPNGATVMVDGINRGTVPLSGPIAISAGVEHDVLVFKDTKAIFEKVVRQPSRNTKVFNIKEYKPINNEQSKDDKTEPKGSQTGKKLKLGGAVISGVGVGMLIAGSILGGMTVSLGNELDNVCKDGCPLNKESDINKVNSRGLAADVLFITGSVVSIVGVVMLVVGVRKNKKNESVAIYPQFGTNFASASLRVRF